MEREHWLELSQAISEVGGRWKESRRFKYPTALIARVYLWSVIHNCAICWACEKQNWIDACLPASKVAWSVDNEPANQHQRI
jgi:hypothetical protein